MRPYHHRLQLGHLQNSRVLGPYGEANLHMGPDMPSHRKTCSRGPAARGAAPDGLAIERSFRAHIRRDREEEDRECEGDSHHGGKQYSKYRFFVVGPEG